MINTSQYETLLSPKRLDSILHGLGGFCWAGIIRNMGSGTICTLELEKVHCHPGSIQPEKVNRNSTGPKKDVALACVHTFGYIWAVVVHDNNCRTSWSVLTTDLSEVAGVYL